MIRILSHKLPVYGLVASLGVALVGCHGPDAMNRVHVSNKLEQRFGTALGPTAALDRALVPEGIEKGLTEDQAVLLALYNNAAFQEALVELDLTRADLIQAGILPNPEFVYYWGAPDKPLKYLIDFPIESLFLRPLRLRAAAAENRRASERVTQLALDLIRDTRQAHSDLRLAADQVEVAERAVALRTEIAKLAKARLTDGDLSPLEAYTAEIDEFQANQDVTRTRYDQTVAQERLRNLTGLSGFAFPLIPLATPFKAQLETSVDDLVAEAVATRPDAVAAAQATQAAVERVRVSRLGWVRFLGILDATSGRNTGHEFGPALRMGVPIFNRNQGGIARAEAELDQLSRRQVTVHNQIVMDVRTAHARYYQARTELDLLETKTRPQVVKVIDAAKAAFGNKNATYLIVLEASRQLIATDGRRAQLSADLRRAWAELERAVGRRLEMPLPAKGSTP